jgi:hypothetical protein
VHRNKFAVFVKGETGRKDKLRFRHSVPIRTELLIGDEISGPLDAKKGHATESV